MGYAEHMRALLRPMGVYDLRPESLSGGELEVLGEAFDLLYGSITVDLREALPFTANGIGLLSYEELTGYPMEHLSVTQRRQALVGLLRMIHLGATEDSLTDAAAFTGVQPAFDESSLPQKLILRLPGASNNAQLRSKLEKYLRTLLPCHLILEFRYN